MQYHQVKTRLANSYVIEDDAGLLVVDVAKDCDGDILHFVEVELQRSVQDIHLVTCTHDDPDHMGGIAAVARSCDAALALPFGANRRDLKLMNNPLGPWVRMMTGMREAFHPRARQMYANPERHRRYQQRPNLHLANASDTKPDEVRLKHRDSLAPFTDWQVVHSPGHSWDSLCFFHANSGTLITGDTLLGSASKGRLVKPAIFDDPLALQRTLQSLKALAPRHVLPGHGSVFTGTDLLSHF